MVGEFGGDGAGFDDADPHVLLGEFLAEGFAEDSDGELGGDVDGGPADGLAAGHGADVVPAASQPGTCSRNVRCGQPHTGQAKRRTLTDTVTRRPSTGTSATVRP
jgi:hypothetical protein